MDLVTDVLSGKRLALARLLTLVENQSPQGQAALDQLFSHTGRAHLIGITGSPGAGKSSLVNHLAKAFRNPVDGTLPRTVGIVAIDPSSPFTGGAVLGDRVRMRDLAGDPGVFIRSMASRGSLGGLARTTAAVVQALDAAGYDLIMIETVGAGQAEVDIAKLAHTTVVVEAPGMGDDIQAIKAGILEIADILVINKADRPGVENTERTLRAMLEIGYNHSSGHHFRENTDDRAESTDSAEVQAESLGWTPPVLKTIAIKPQGIAELAQAVEAHAAFLHESGEWQARERIRLQSELDQLIQAVLVDRWRAGLDEQNYQKILNRLTAREISPHQAAHGLIDMGNAPMSSQK